jgi:hypothetical protein
MRLRTFVLALALALLSPLVASAQRGLGAGEWELLGQQTVGFGVDNDAITINRDEGWFRDRGFDKLRFTAEGNDVHLIALRIVYINGYTEDIRVDRRIDRASQLVVDLPGQRSYIQRIGMTYRSAPTLSLGQGGIRLQQAVVKVYGQRAGRLPPPAAVPIAGWSELDTKSFRLREEEVAFDVSVGDGRIGQIKLRSTGERVNVRSVRIRFGNNQTQTVAINQRLENGEETRSIDLEGERRWLRSVVVELEPRRRPGRGELRLLALERPGGTLGVVSPGDPYAARGWQLLGAQSVGFAVDRDVVNVAQPEEWYRSRAFRTLHFVAERNEVHLMSVRIVYINGWSEDLQIDRLIPTGGAAAVDLRGERSYLRQIEMTYRSRPSFRGQAVVKVYGEPVGR